MRWCTRISFVMKCTFVSGLFMFVSMAAGEIFVDPNLFSGFLKRPDVWYGIFLESAIATVPICLIVMAVLALIGPVGKKSHMMISTGIWLLMGLLVLALYKIFYWPREWHLTSIQPGLMFGWIIPCILILGSVIYFSKSLYIERGS